jgi:hypothetical protein
MACCYSNNRILTSTNSMKGTTMFIKTIDHNTKDVFLGKGWDNWVRVTKTDNKFLRTAGMTITMDVTNKINDRIKQMDIASAKKMVGIK